VNLNTFSDEEKVTDPSDPPPLTTQKSTILKKTLDNPFGDSTETSSASPGEIEESETNQTILPDAEIETSTPFTLNNPIVGLAPITFVQESTSSSTAKTTTQPTTTSSELSSSTSTNGKTIVLSTTAGSDGSPKIDLGIFGSFWLEKPKQVKNNEDLTTERPSPVFKLEDYTDKFKVF